MNAFTRFDRHREVGRIRGHLERIGFPRLQMFVLVTLTGATGFIASFLFLRAGLLEMWIRYFASISVAYLMFLFLLWLWLRTRAEDFANFSDVPTPSSDSGMSGSCLSGEIDDIHGNCVSASLDTRHESATVVSDMSDSMGEALASCIEAEEFAIPLFILILLGAMLFSSLFMIYSAPVLFAELLVDGALAASLYRRLRGIEARHWLETAFRRTVVPFILTAVIVSASGWGMAIYAPEAYSIGDVISHLKHSSS